MGDWRSKFEDIGTSNAERQTELTTKIAKITESVSMKMMPRSPLLHIFWYRQRNVETRGFLAKKVRFYWGILRFWGRKRKGLRLFYIRRYLEGVIWGFAGPLPRILSRNDWHSRRIGCREQFWATDSFSRREFRSNCGRRLFCAPKQIGEPGRRFLFGFSTRSGAWRK